MRKEEFAEVLGDINENYVKEAEAIQKTRKRAWVKWGAAAACLCFVIVGVMTWKSVNTQPAYGQGTLVGADEIYPTIMVDGKLYEWRRGAAICNELPNDCVYYGELTHIKGQTPANDGEFASVFPVSGQIYTVPEKNGCIYLCLTTEWMNNTVVLFDLIE